MESSGTGANLSIARLHKSSYRGGYTFHLNIKTNNKRKQTTGQAYFQDIVIMIVLFVLLFFIFIFLGTRTITLLLHQ